MRVSSSFTPELPQVLAGPCVLVFFSGIAKVYLTQIRRKVDEEQPDSHVCDHSFWKNFERQIMTLNLHDRFDIVFEMRPTSIAERV